MTITQQLQPYLKNLTPQEVSDVINIIEAEFERRNNPLPRAEDMKKTIIMLAGCHNAPLIFCIVNGIKKLVCCQCLKPKNEELKSL